jgi:hypothetical protein
MPSRAMKEREEKCEYFEVKLCIFSHVIIQWSTQQRLCANVTLRKKIKKVRSQ